jgi:UDP-N-acetylmuramoyl-L-alanyl-D-glutamate--2,6-diaminopimelate ligase
MKALKMQKKLAELVATLGLSTSADEGEIPVSGIVLDSRQVQPGNLFVALIGDNVDGHHFIPQAVQRGAAAIVGSRTMSNPVVPYFQVNDGRTALADLAAAFWDYPARRLTVIGVTGTDGKTTTANLIYSIMQAAGLRVGMITTVNAVIGDQQLDTGFHVTTPEAPEVQHYLAEMVSAGLTHAILEATSHGLSQKRVANCEFDIGVVTNITHEHLDYHGSYDAYCDAKAILFTSLLQTSLKGQGVSPVAVLNRDDESYEFLNTISGVRKLSYGMDNRAQVRGTKVSVNTAGTNFWVCGKDYEFPFESNLVGEHNIYNCLAAIAVTVDGLDLPPSIAQKGIAALEGIPGRMEVIDAGQEFMAIVDFAHTPNALRNSLETARKLIPGRVIAIFGSAGLRDREKRRHMAEISAELADFTVLTAEDPRTESLDNILGEMSAGAESRGAIKNQTYWSVRDRGEAIRFGISLARPGDVVIACGKGHEQSMCFGKIEYPWDDRIAMRAALAEQLTLPGPKMPYLPTQKESDE